MPSARLRARLVLGEWGLAGLSDSAELVVSELVTNAVRASRQAGCDAMRMWLVSDLGQAVAFIWDASPLRPVPAAPGADAEGGRGLLLVDAVSSRWGTSRTTQAKSCGQPCPARMAPTASPSLLPPSAS